MRTTLTVPDDLHAALVAIARDRHETVSRTVETLLRRALSPTEHGAPRVSPVTGFATLQLDRVITSEDVDAVDDV